MSAKKLVRKSEGHKTKTRISTTEVKSELLKLRTVEKTLENILELVNNQINALQVEKLQLEARYNEQQNSNNSKEIEINDKEEEIQLKGDVPIEEINKQVLGTLSPVVFELDEEFESDD